MELNTNKMRLIKIWIKYEQGTHLSQDINSLFVFCNGGRVFLVLLLESSYFSSVAICVGLQCLEPLRLELQLNNIIYIYTQHILNSNQSPLINTQTQLILNSVTNPHSSTRLILNSVTNPHSSTHKHSVTNPH